MILDKPVSDAMKRSEKYLQAGADGIMIHSKDKNPANIFNFANEKKIFKYKSTVVPSSFNQVKEKLSKILV